MITAEQAAELAAHQRAHIEKCSAVNSTKLANSESGSSAGHVIKHAEKLPALGWR